MPSIIPTLLSTPRLALRQLQQSDAVLLLPIFSDPEVMYYWSTVPWVSIDVTHQLITNDIVTHQHGALFSSRNSDSSRSADHRNLHVVYKRPAKLARRISDTE